MTYNQFLLSQLLRAVYRQFDNLEYDRMYDLIPQIYEDYEDSKWYEQDKSHYDCILDYIHNENPLRFLED